jgi:hypothetical protein
MARSFDFKGTPKGDELARAMAGVPLDQVLADNELNPTEEFLNDPNKNPGMKRMIVGNVLRGRLRRGEYVKVGATEFNKTSH